MQLFF